MWESSHTVVHTYASGPPPIWIVLTPTDVSQGPVGAIPDIDSHRSVSWPLLKYVEINLQKINLNWFIFPM
jgi:hypothetical protein